MPHFTITLQNDTGPDASEAMQRHVPFYWVHRAVGQAWVRALVDACGDVLDPVSGTVAVNVSSNFRHELFVGDSDIEVVLEKIGTSSITVGVAVSQEDVLAAEVTAVLVHIDSGRGQAAPWSPAQVAALESLLRVTSPR
ncbi:MAG: thioesterase family protein [Rhodococcus sp. (in: high G+C Gram-positive bacteria)]|uniref:acyl-CoA thioesterase n=1 Tax=Rhodococcus sp. TaxID=1831 RepID=UPI003BAE88D0